MDVPDAVLMTGIPESIASTIDPPGGTPMPDTTSTTHRSAGRRWSRTAIPLGVAALLALGSTAGPALATTARTSAVIATSLTPPTGHDRVGTVRLHVVDRTRIDPMSPTHAVRGLMVQIWYPATDTREFPPTPYMQPLAAAHFLSERAQVPGLTLPPTVGHTGAPVDRRHGPRPVVLYSPASNQDASINTGLVEELASHGYIVVTIDVTNQSPEVEFPGGRLVVGTFPDDTLDEAILGQQVRADDAHFVLNELTVLNRGGNPDAEHAALPRGLAGSLDLNRVGMLGWSRGGAASAQAMNEDPRIKAGVNLDGGFIGPLAQQGVTRPFLLMTGSENTNEPSMAQFMAASTGPKLRLALDNSMHPTFSDAEDLEPEVAPDQVTADLGTINPKTAIADQRAYVRAFFDKYLRGRNEHLLDGPSPRFPDIHFLP
jgi:predicted dienelactone hydrolase